MKAPRFIASQRLANEEKFYIATLQHDSTIVKVQKTVILKDLPDEEEPSNFKPPVFLIAIGLAILYQVVYRNAGVLWQQQV